MPGPSVPTIAVIGGGASGTLAAAHLLRAADGPVRVVLVERRAEAGRGVAYSTADPAHRLNVPAGKMSAFPDAPDHFVDWLTAGPDAPLPAATAATFAPRALFGRYLAETLARTAADAAPGVVLEHVRAEALGVDAEDGRLVVRLDGAADSLPRARSGVVADRVVVAVGHGALARVPALDGLPPGVLVPDPWAPGALDAVAPGADVLVVGTGLTMVDVAVTLAGRVGSIVAVSRRGLVPLGHARAGAPPVEARVAESPTPTALLRSLRTEAARAGSWRAAVDALRPETAARWQSFSDPDKRSFLRHLRPYWDVHRHRTAPDVMDVVDGLRASGRLRTVAGRVVRAEAVAGGARVVVGRRGGGADRRSAEETFGVQSVVVCTGARPAADTPLVRQLVAAGLARPDPLGLGLDADADGALVGADGRAAGALFTLGPLRQGGLWESTAVPEIRAQAAALARRPLAP